MKRTTLALIASLVSCTALAQPPQTLPANTVVGRLGTGPGPAQAIPFATLSAALSGGAGSTLISPVFVNGQLNINTVDMTARNRGPLFVLNDPQSSGNPAGRNMGCQFWVGDNPTATPGADQSVNCTFYIDNHNRDGLWGQDIVTLYGDNGSGWAETSGRGLEVEVLNFFTANSTTDPWGSANTRKNGIEIVAGVATLGRTTAGLTTWGAQTNGNGWFDTSIALSRGYNYGVRCVADPGGNTDMTSAFKTACFSDESDSTNVLRVTRTHTNLIDLSSGPTIGSFVRGSSSADTELRFTNAANHAMELTIDSGVGAANLSVLNFTDRLTGKWSIIKDTSNKFIIQNQALVTQPFSIDPANDKATFTGDVGFTKTLQMSFGTGVITITKPASSSTYNFNLPATAGSGGDCLLSGGGGTAAMTWGSCGAGGTGTVTSVATTAPISGGTITTSGTLSCPTCVSSAAALTNNALMIGQGLQASATTGTGAGVLTALGVSVGSAGAFVVNGGALGTPSGGTVTNLTGTASININGTVGATTPTTGAFTTLSASGAVQISDTGMSYTLGSWGVGTASGTAIGLGRTVHVVSPSGTAGFEIGVTGLNTSAFYLATDASTFAVLATASSGITMNLQVNNTDRLVLTSTGVNMPTLPTSAGAGGVYLCIDTSGVIYKKSGSCP